MNQKKKQKEKKQKEKEQKEKGRKQYEWESKDESGAFAVSDGNDVIFVAGSSYGSNGSTVSKYQCGFDPDDHYDSVINFNSAGACSGKACKDIL